jgi:hypothetical protein
MKEFWMTKGMFLVLCATGKPPSPNRQILLAIVNLTLFSEIVPRGLTGPPLR